MRNEIKIQTEDLLAYYPGRGRGPLLWLIVIPVLPFLVSTVVFPMVFGHGAVEKVSSDVVPHNMFYMAGHSFIWIYRFSLVIMLIRICHSERRLWRESVQIMGSSLTYSLIVGLPFVVLAFTWILCHFGTSPIAFTQVLVGLICAVGALLLLLACLGALSHRFGIVVPFLIFLTSAYTHLLPMNYPTSMVLPQWQFFHTFAVPLSPAITLFRQGMLNQDCASGSVWIAALLHAVAGYGFTLWIWKSTSEPKDQQVFPETTPVGTPPEKPSY